MGVDAEHDPGDAGGSHWDGYSDYRTISLRMANTIADAIDAYSKLDAAHREGAPVNPSDAAQLRARIQRASIELIPEMEQDRDDVELYDRVLTRWKGGEGTGAGLVARLDETAFTEECPGWLFQVCLDMKRVGFKLGYLAAGRHESEPDDPVAAETNAMFQGV